MDNKVERAIIMAAGLGNRMKPVSDFIPKPLITVNGIRMIDTVIDGLISNGIDDIVVVVGYKKDAFDILKEKYNQLEIIYNPDYSKYNNISSLYYARERLNRPCMILDGDQIIYNSKILSPYFEKSGYSAVWVDESTNEWLMQEKDGRVISCSRTGGDKGWQLYSISRWSEEDAKKLKKYVKLEYEVNKNRQIYWDDVPMFIYFDEFELGITPIKMGDLVEVDSIDELIVLDASYRRYLEYREV